MEEKIILEPTSLESEYFLKGLELSSLFEKKKEEKKDCTIMQILSEHDELIQRLKERKYSIPLIQRELIRLGVVENVSITTLRRYFSSINQVLKEDSMDNVI